MNQDEPIGSEQIASSSYRHSSGGQFAVGFLSALTLAGTAVAAFFVNCAAIVVLVLHDVPGHGGKSYSSVSGGCKIELTALLLANLGLFAYLLFKRKRQLVICFGLGAVLPMILLLVGLFS